MVSDEEVKPFSAGQNKKIEFQQNPILGKSEKFVNFF
jgi:hypothetical protein